MWLPGHEVNKPDTSEVLPFISSIGGTTSHPGMCDFVGVGEGTRQWQGVAGIGGRLTSGICVVDSHHVLPVMPRCLDTHRSAWISQQPRQSAEFAPFKVWIDIQSGGWEWLWAVYGSPPCR